MKDNHYESKDYQLISKAYQVGLSYLSSRDKRAFTYILHNLYDAIYTYDPSFALKMYNNMKEFQIHFLDDDVEIYDKAKKKYEDLFYEFFQNMLVDINEHHGL